MRRQFQRRVKSSRDAQRIACDFQQVAAIGGYLDASRVQVAAHAHNLCIQEHRDAFGLHRHRQCSAGMSARIYDRRDADA